MCDICSKTFYCAITLGIHRRYHTRPKEVATNESYDCPKCGKSFKFQKSLNEHGRRKHQGKGISCEHCGKLFSYKS